MPESTDDRASIAQGWALSSKVTSIALEMVLPAVAGYWLDTKCGTKLVFLVLGAILGMTVGMISLLRMTSPNEDDKISRGGSSEPPSSEPLPPSDRTK